MAELRRARRRGLDSSGSTPRSSLEGPSGAVLETTRTTLSDPPSVMSTTRLFVASIGNPAPYLNTLHSAGHTVNHQLALALHHPPFAKSRSHANGLLSESSSSRYTLWQSPSLMNISGSALSTAYRTFMQEYANDGKLIVLHDELELQLGEVKVRSGSLSHKGHNGLKSIKERMGSVDYTRIGIGIGRPQSRAPDDVANFVLRKMTPAEKMKLEGTVRRVVAELSRLAG